MILPLIIAPNPLLKQVSKPVEQVTDEIRDFMQKMVKTMYAEKGVGLAAVQVGRLSRIFVMDVDYEELEHFEHNHANCDGIHIKNPKPQFFINPEIIEESSEISVFNEGCLSFPTLRTKISRPKIIKLRYIDFNGKEQIQSFDEISATCIQHEIDHLNGITFLDHTNPIKREMMLKKLQKIKNRYA